MCETLNYILSFDIPVSRMLVCDLIKLLESFSLDGEVSYLSKLVIKASS